MVSFKLNIKSKDLIGYSKQSSSVWSYDEEHEGGIRTKNMKNKLKKAVSKEIREKAKEDITEFKHLPMWGLQLESTG